MDPELNSEQEVKLEQEVKSLRLKNQKNQICQRISKGRGLLKTILQLAIIRRSHGMPVNTMRSPVKLINIKRSPGKFARFLLLIPGRYGAAVLFFSMLFFSQGVAFGQPPKQLTLLFAGDIMGHDTQIEAARMMGGGEYDYSSCFRYVEPYIAAADIAIGNLEVTLAGPPYKGYPQFSSPDALANALKNAGFDILVQANNHAVDRGKAGLERTLTVLDSIGMVRSGVFRDSRERLVRYPLIVEKNGIRLALLNYTYSTNGIRVTPPNIVNSIDTFAIRQDLQKAATADPDFTIALMHWGSEYQLTENSKQQKLARFLFRNGTDAIFGSHPHVVQPIREIDGKLVVYSLGNMVSNQRKRYTDGGILFGMTLEKSYSIRVTGTMAAGTRVTNASESSAKEAGTREGDKKVVRNRIAGATLAGTKKSGVEEVSPKEAGTEVSDTRETGAREVSYKAFVTKDIGKDMTVTRVTGYHYLPIWVHKPITDQGATFSLVPAAIDSVFWEEMNISAGDAESMLLFLEDTRNNLKGVIELKP